jgi:hypothetical protein
VRQCAPPLLAAQQHRTLCTKPTVNQPLQSGRDNASDVTGLDAVRRAWTFLWDPEEPNLHWRIGAAFCLMIGAKLIAIQVPFLFKFAIDGLSEPAAAAAAAGTSSGGLASTGLLALTPASLLLLYGATRALADGMQQLRNALFARVSEGALRRMARRTFTHLHALELSFHLERQTGALNRVVERGTRAVGTLLSTSLLQVLPLAFEVRTAKPHREATEARVRCCRVFNGFSPPHSPHPPRPPPAPR